MHFILLTGPLGEFDNIKKWKTLTNVVNSTFVSVFDGALFIKDNLPDWGSGFVNQINYTHSRD